MLTTLRPWSELKGSDTFFRRTPIKEGASVVAAYTYDALGRRVEKAAGGVTTRYYYDSGWQVLAETDEDDDLQREYVYGNYLDEVVMAHDAVATEDYYYVHDHLYSPVALLEDDGDVIERYEYNAYGERVALNPTTFAQQTPSANAPVIAFTGQRVDVLDGGDLEVMYYKNRYYNTETGRFLTRDPIGYKDGMNLYKYVDCIPTMYTDPLGYTKDECLQRKEILIAQLEGYKKELSISPHGFNYHYFEVFGLDELFNRVIN